MTCFLFRFGRLFFALVVLLTLVSSEASARANRGEGKRLACYFYDRKSPHHGISMRHPSLPFVWATGRNGEQIVVEGELVDGFFTVQKMAGEKRARHRQSVYPNRNSLAQEFCQRGLVNQFPQDYANKVIIQMRIRPYTLSPLSAPVFSVHDGKGIRAINKLVVFGDSLSDQGNLKERLRVFPQKPYFAGRFTDREIWIDYVHRVTGVAVQNWAYGGSVAYPQVPLNPQTVGLGQRLLTIAQIKTTGHIEKEIARYRKHSLHGGTVQQADSTLFVLWIGGNDYIRLFETDGDADQFLDHPNHSKIGAKMVVNRVTDRIITDVENLYELGARHIYVANLPDLGTTPRILQNKSYHRHNKEIKEISLFLLSRKVSALIQLHNDTLAGKLAQLGQSYQDLDLIIGDPAALTKHIDTSTSIDSSNSFFDYDIDQDYVARLTHQNHTITIHKPCIRSNFVRKSKMMRTDARRYSFFDDLHPTSYVHSVLAAHFHQQVAEHGLLAPVSVMEYLHLARPEMQIAASVH